MLPPARVQHPLSELVYMTCWPRYTSNSRRRYINPLRPNLNPPPLPNPCFPHQRHLLTARRRMTSWKCLSSVTSSGAGLKIFDRRNTGPLSCWSRKRRKHQCLPGRRRTKYIYVNAYMYAAALADCSLLFVMWLHTLEKAFLVR